MGRDTWCRMKTRKRCGTRPRRWAPKTHFFLKVVGVAWSFVCWYSPRHGYVAVELIRHRREGPDERVYLTLPEPEMKRRVVGGGGSDSPHQHLAPIESDVLTRFPSLVAHCCITRYDDGEPRKPGWVTIKTLGSAWVVQAKDPDACASLTATGPTLDEALTLADLLLGAEEAPWEPDPFLKKLGGKKSG